MMASDDGVSVFESVRPRLFGIAYRMLGSAAEAERQRRIMRWPQLKHHNRHDDRDYGIAECFDSCGSHQAKTAQPIDL